MRSGNIKMGLKSKSKIPKLKIKRNVFLKDKTTFRIGGKAKYFFEAKTKEELIKAIKWAKGKNLPFFILGGGSNVLVSDEGYKGLVIKFQFSIFNCRDNKIITGAGTPLGKLVIASADRELSGLEWAAGIPGTVGGAIRGNVEAFNVAMEGIVKEVEAFDVNDWKIKKLKNKDCAFSYKESIFKKNKNLIILSAILQLKKEKKEKIKKKIKEYLNYRKNNHPLNFPSAGCIFKNCKLEKISFGKKKIVPAGWLIEKCGLKGKKIGNVKISEVHANFIVNLGEGRARDVITLINLAKKEVKRNFGVILEEEIEYLF